MKVGVYLRVSTSDQEKGIQSQEHAIHNYLKGHGLKAIWFRDRISGATSKRPGLDRLEKAIFNGQVDTVVVWRLDRLSRKGTREGINLLGKWLEKGVRVVSVTEQFDFSGDVGQLVASVLFAVARMQRQSMIENIKRGLATARANGVRLGRPAKLRVADIRPLLEQGTSITAIARRLEVSRQAVYDVLRRQP